MGDTIYNPTTGNTALKFTADDKIDFIAPVKLAGTELTATAAELNALDGITASVAELNIMDGVTKTAAQINLLVAGAAGGYKLARGVAAVNAASVDVATSLTTVVAAVVSMVGDPDMNHMFSSVTVGDQAGAPAAGSIRIKSWRPTAVDNCTPIAAQAAFSNVSWVAIGT